MNYKNWYCCCTAILPNINLLETLTFYNLSESIDPQLPINTTFSLLSFEAKICPFEVVASSIARRTEYVTTCFVHAFWECARRVTHDIYSYGDICISKFWRCDDIRRPSFEVMIISCFFFESCEVVARSLV